MKIPILPSDAYAARQREQMERFDWAERMHDAEQRRRDRLADCDDRSRRRPDYYDCEAGRCLLDEIRELSTVVFPDGRRDEVARLRDIVELAVPRLAELDEPGLAEWLHTLLEE